MTPYKHYFIPYNVDYAIIKDVFD